MRVARTPSLTKSKPPTAHGVLKDRSQISARLIVTTASVDSSASTRHLAAWCVSSALVGDNGDRPVLQAGTEKVVMTTAPCVKTARPVASFCRAFSQPCAGKYTSSPGQTGCTEARPGYYVPPNGSRDRDVPCPAGSRSLAEVRNGSCSYHHVVCLAGPHVVQSMRTWYFHVN